MKKYLYVLAAIFSTITTILFNFVLVQSIIKSPLLTLTPFAAQLMVVGIAFCVLYTTAHALISAIELFYNAK